MPLVSKRPTLIARISALDGYLVNITWRGGKSEIKDLEPLVVNHRRFAQIRRQREMFETIDIVDDGSRIGWIDGSSMTALAVAKLPPQTMTTEEFCAAMTDLNLTSDALASMLGLSRRVITNYRTGFPIPKSVALAVRFILAGWNS